MINIIRKQILQIENLEEDLKKLHEFAARFIREDLACEIRVMVDAPEKIEEFKDPYEEAEKSLNAFSLRGSLAVKPDKPDRPEKQYVEMSFIGDGFVEAISVIIKHKEYELAALKSRVRKDLLKSL